MIVHFNENKSEDSSSENTFFDSIAEIFEKHKVHGFIDTEIFDSGLSSQESQLQPSSLNRILQELDRDRKHNDFVLKILFILKDQCKVEIDS